jgi:hypothetical protein
MWSQVPTNTFNLLRITAEQLQSLKNITQSNQIFFDTTTHTKYGHFLWTSSFQPDANIISKNDTTLVSETLFSKNYPVGACLTFMYLISGSNSTSRINVYKKFISSNSPLENIYSSEIGVTKTWMQALVSPGIINQNFELYLQVETGDPKLDDNIAIDDLFLVQDDCRVIPIKPEPDSPFPCGDNVYIEYRRVCDFIKDCLNGEDEQICGDCDFENSTCQYSDMSFGDIRWTREQAGLSQYGPIIDSTLKSPFGHYMFVDENNNGVNFYDFAYFQLQTDLKPCSALCEIEFYYYAIGDSDELGVYLLADGIYTLLTEITGDFGDKWNKVLLPIGRVSKEFKIEFEGFKLEGDNMYNKLAIDDIKFKNCQFPEVNTLGCPVDYFTCDRLACITSNLVCDLTDDCGDNSGKFFFQKKLKKCPKPEHSFSFFKMNQIVIITRNVILKMVFVIGLII